MTIEWSGFRGGKVAEDRETHRSHCPALLTSHSTNREHLADSDHQHNSSFLYRSATKLLSSVKIDDELGTTSRG